tara:strand:+ start:321 stop:602 length:282 start_codon:yes stop_codon:yes gene_type:complete
MSELRNVIKDSIGFDRFRLTVNKRSDGSTWSNYKLKSVTDADFDVLREFEYETMNTKDGTELSLAMSPERLGRSERPWISLNMDERPSLSDEM